MFHLLVEQNKQIDGSIKDEKSIKAVVTASSTQVCFFACFKNNLSLIDVLCFVQRESLA